MSAITLPAAVSPQAANRKETARFLNRTVSRENRSSTNLLQALHCCSFKLRRGDSEPDVKPAGFSDLCPVNLKLLFFRIIRMHPDGRDIIFRAVLTGRLLFILFPDRASLRIIS